MNRNGSVSINDDQGRELERYPIPQGTVISASENSIVPKGAVFVHWDPYTYPILTEVAGTVRYEDLREGVTVRQEVNKILICQALGTKRGKILESSHQ